MVYRTRTYIAGDWDGDSDLIEKLREWNYNDNLALSFSDAHKMTQARDTSLPCSIKKSLKERLDGSKTFVLVVGSGTDSLTQGACKHCSSYSAYYGCHRGHGTDHRSYIHYECDYAAEHSDRMRIVVLYNFSTEQRSKCPDSVRYKGTHLPAFYLAQNGKYYWDYQAIMNAIEG